MQCSKRQMGSNNTLHPPLVVSLVLFRIHFLFFFCFFFFFDPFSLSDLPAAVSSNDDLYEVPSSELVWLLSTPLPMQFSESTLRLEVDSLRKEWDLLRVFPCWRLLFFSITSSVVSDRVVDVPRTVNLKQHNYGMVSFCSHFTAQVRSKFQNIWGKSEAFSANLTR